MSTYNYHVALQLPSIVSTEIIINIELIVSVATGEQRLKSQIFPSGVGGDQNRASSGANVRPHLQTDAKVAPYLPDVKRKVINLLNCSTSTYSSNTHVSLNVIYSTKHITATERYR